MPFVVCHAAALGEWVDSQLDGLMRRARRGTLFFDAIEEMPLRAQDQTAVDDGAESMSRG